MDLVSYVRRGLPGAGLLSGLIAVCIAPWECSSGVDSGSGSLHLPPRAGALGLSPSRLEVQARAKGKGAGHSEQATVLW